VPGLSCVTPSPTASTTPATSLWTQHARIYLRPRRFGDCSNIATALRAIHALAGHDAPLDERERALAVEHIAVADTAGVDADADLARPRLRNGPPLQREFVQATWPVEPDRGHGRFCLSLVGTNSPSRVSTTPYGTSPPAPSPPAVPPRRSTPSRAASGGAATARRTAKAAAAILEVARTQLNWPRRP